MLRDQLQAQRQLFHSYQQRKLKEHQNYSSGDYMYQSELSKNNSYKLKIKLNRNSVQAIQRQGMSPQYDRVSIKSKNISPKIQTKDRFNT